MKTHDVDARQKQRVSFPLISALYIQLGEPAYSRAHSGVCTMNKMRMREGLEPVADLGGGGGAAAPPPSEGSRRPHPFVYDAQGCKFEGKVAEASAEGA